MKTHIIIHHSGSTTEHDQFMSIDNFHRKRGFPKSELGYHVGYHYIIDRDEKIHQARNDWEKGAHTYVDGEKNGGGWNDRAIGICVVGDFTHESPEKWSIELLGKLVKRLQLVYNIPSVNIKLHRDLEPTACPGVDWVRFIRQVPEPEGYLEINQARRYERILKRLSRLPKKAYQRAMKRLPKYF